MRCANTLINPKSRKAQWMVSARETQDPALRRLKLRYAHSANREIIRTLIDLKKRQVDRRVQQ